MRRPFEDLSLLKTAEKIRKENEGTMGKMKDAQIDVMNLRQQILDSQDIESKTITVKKWGGAKLLITGLSAEERDTARDLSTVNGKVESTLLGYHYFVAAVRDPLTKEKIFEVSDIEALRKKDSGVIDYISGLVMKFSWLDEESMETAEKK
jgi:hypothetical protein